MNVSSSFEGNTRRHSAGLGNEGGKGRKSVILSRLLLEKQAASHNSERLGEVWLRIFPYPWVLILQYFQTSHMANLTSVAREHPQAERCRKTLTSIETVYKQLPQDKPKIYGQVPITSLQFSSVDQQCPTFANPLTAACQASLSITIFQSLLKLMSL